MEWGFTAYHIISGSVPVMLALVLYFILLQMMGKKQTTGHVIASVLFCLYLTGILAVTGVCLKGSFSPRFEFIPFVDMIRGPLDTVLNILLFVPLGCFLPLLYEKYDCVFKIAFIALLISLSIEIAQMFSSGATDINDLIPNTTGACLGYGIYAMLRKSIPKSWIDQIRVDGSQCYYELILYWAGSLLIMLTLQVHLFHVLFAASMPSDEIHVMQN